MIMVQQIAVTAISIAFLIALAIMWRDEAKTFKD